MLSKHRGEFFLILGAFFFALSGIVVIVVLKHLPAFRLAEFRSVTAVVILGTFVLLTRPDLVRIVRSEIPKLGVYGVVGFAMVNFGYLLGIQRGVPIALVLIIEFTASIWIALWIKFVRKAFVARDMWVAIALSLLGLILVSKAWNGFTFDLIGIAGAVGSAFALAAYFLMSEKIGKKREPIAMLIFGMGFASIFWLIVLPPWSFPFEIFTMKMDLGGITAGVLIPGWVMMAAAALIGTVIPYLCVLTGMRLLTASTSSVIGMIEPVLAGAFAWVWFGQSWDAIQLVGAVVVLFGIYLADRAKSVTSQ
ncbi:MAG: DMT family transporter [Actinobacteria bacterium]|nr:DMT family transporter [Actinomycetota bacterium]